MKRVWYLLIVPVLFFFLPRAFAGLSADLESQIAKVVDRVKQAQNAYGNEPCGGYVRIRAEDLPIVTASFVPSAAPQQEAPKIQW